MSATEIPPRAPSRPSWREVALLIAILALAALLRLPGLDQRGQWDADQGTDMLVLQGLVDRGEVPLLGPKTSIGTFHHGAVYYYLLAPAAFLSGADPVAVTTEIALFGIGAVAAVWWLARLIGGPVAGLAAAVLAAVSPAGIEASTFIWNPNLIPLGSAVAFAAALHAIRSRHARWWLLSALGAMVVMQCHVLGVVVVPPLLVAWLADVRGRRRRDERLGPLVAAGAGGLAILAAGYVPLLASELQHDFAETRAILGYLGGGGGSAASGALARISIVGLRSIAWPVSGVLTDRPLLAVLAVVAVIALAALAILGERGTGRRAASWLAASIAWSVVALALFAPSLAQITPGLPNDHYHSFLDPLVLALVGAGLARLAGVARPAGAGGDRRRGRALPGRRHRHRARRRVRRRVAPGDVPRRGLAARRPGGRANDRRRGRRAISAGRASRAFKNANALRFPLEHRGVTAIAGRGHRRRRAARVVIVCDPLFDDVVGAACGGPAEDALRWPIETSGLVLRRPLRRRPASRHLDLRRRALASPRSTAGRHRMRTTLRRAQIVKRGGQ